MYDKSWEQIEQLYLLPNIDATTIEAFKALKSTQSFHTKKEGAPRHYCSFFLPYDRVKNMIYLGHHKKANDWISPGGHIEPGETPMDAAIREMKEELNVDIAPNMLEPWHLSVKEINRPEVGCVAHYDIWHLVHIPVQPFDFLKSEYYDAAWFTVQKGVAKISKNPDFARIISQINYG